MLDISILKPGKEYVFIMVNGHKNYGVFLHIFYDVIYACYSKIEYTMRIDRIIDIYEYDDYINIGII